jgi:sterol desaturase/sphingolipid hydroxylase (fatty acid hydroxylase superfamily)
LLLSDFLNWLHHFIRHKVELFWYFHAIHHSQLEMNLFTDLRVHGFERVIAKPIVFLPLFMLQLDAATAVWLVLAQEWYSRVYHANIRSNYGVLKHFMVTPQSHRIHHSIEPRHRDKNFGVIFTVWDRMFGTLYPSYDDYPDTGVDDPDFPLEGAATPAALARAYFAQMVYPFRQALARARAAT